MDEYENVELEKICRVCLNQKDDLRPLFQGSVAEMLREVASIQVYEDDGLPSLLCDLCIREISRWYAFKLRVTNNDSTLRCIILERQKTKHFDDSDTEDPSSEFRDLEIKFEEECKQAVIESEGEKNKTLVSKGDLTSTNSTDNKFICELCKKAVKTIHSLRRHMKIHTGEKPHKCKLCDKSFVEPGNLTKHLQTHKKIHRGERSFVCPECNKSFSQKVNLESHIRTKHTHECPFMCSECGKAYPTKEQLKNHCRRHTGEKRPLKYTCTSCQKQFGTPAELRIHTRTHTNERPYQCDFCGKNFRASSHMTSHRRIHTGEKNHVCRYCGKAFRESSTLKIHIRIHTGERPYCCQICGTSFTQSNTLNTHMKIHNNPRDS
ncbi:hypothetical protein ILUMI_09440 [Ignelater luminosus]|uniref:Uncharacterized protein n=1 Tax=Ignelater luminosus TaxID=2038154 RepID=A0A8K0D519_IGNLU|nr:hypothetical protein ILUMI_09440 [Ignelater luminosus]